jgi:hypothetical protein
MVSYGHDKAAAQAVWQPFLDQIAAAPRDYRLAGKPTIADMPARKRWDAEFRKKYAADSIVSDPRPEANPRDFSFAGDHDEIGAFWRGFETLWPRISCLTQRVHSRTRAQSATLGNFRCTRAQFCRRYRVGEPSAATILSRKPASNDTRNRLTTDQGRIYRADRGTTFSVCKTVS